MIKRLRLPLPWGNQPDEPCDDPISFIVSDYLGREDCLAGYNRDPKIPCILGERAECAWGLRSELDHFCMWRYLARRRGEEAEAGELSVILGVSKERVRKLVSFAQESAKCQLQNNEIAEEYVEAEKLRQAREARARRQSRSRARLMPSTTIS